MYSLPMSTTFAALTIASAASTEPISPRVSTMPSASDAMRVTHSSRIAEYHSSFNAFPNVSPARSRAADAGCPGGVRPHHATGDAGCDADRHYFHATGGDRHADRNELPVRRRAECAA